MTRWRHIPRAGLLAAMLLGAGAGAAMSAETMRVGGVGAAAGMLPHLFAIFDPSGGTKLEIIPSLGTSGGLRALSEGALDVAVSGRTLKPEELSSGVTPVAAIRTPFGLVTSHPHPDGFKSSEVAGLFTSAKPTWKDGSPILIILRPKSDSDTEVLGTLFLDMAAAIEQARKRPDLSLAATDQDNGDLAERLPGSLTGSTFTQIKMERRNLRFIAIDGVEASLENLMSRTYPFAKTLYFVLPAKKSPVAERFVAFLQSPAGQNALIATGSQWIAQ